MGQRAKLSAFSVAAGLMGLHYGTGFLLGTGEKVYAHGLGGTIYAVACSFGLFALMIYVPLYHSLVERIEIVMETAYKHKAIGASIAFLSWIWMVGIISAQIMGTTYVLLVWKMVDVSTGMIILSVLIGSISTMELGKISKIFKALLAISSIGLVASLLVSRTFPLYLHAMIHSWVSYREIGLAEILGIALPTIFITMIGMDFHQFIVQAKDSNSAMLGCLLSGILLLFMAFLPTSAVIAAKEIRIKPMEADGKTILPLMLANIEKMLHFPLIGSLFIISLLVAALGSGIGVNRAAATTFKDFLEKYAMNGKRMPLLFYTMVNALFSFIIALTGKTIVNIIVNFYAIYVAGVFMPFLAFVLQRGTSVKFSSQTILFSIMLGSGCSIVMLMLWHLPIVTLTLLLKQYFFNSLEFAMIALGLLSSTLVLGASLILQKTIFRPL